jgi:hypothetical protein
MASRIGPSRSAQDVGDDAIEGQHTEALDVLGVAVEEPAVMDDQAVAAPQASTIGNQDVGGCRIHGPTAVQERCSDAGEGRSRSGEELGGSGSRPGIEPPHGLDDDACPERA